jgi:hypothetical protein
MRLFHLKIYLFVIRMTILDHANLFGGNHTLLTIHYNVAQFQAEMHEYSFELINVSN